MREPTKFYVVLTNADGVVNAVAGYDPLNSQYTYAYTQRRWAEKKAESIEGSFVVETVFSCEANGLYPWSMKHQRTDAHEMIAAQAVREQVEQAQVEQVQVEQVEQAQVEQAQVEQAQVTNNQSGVHTMSTLSTELSAILSGTDSNKTQAMADLTAFVKTRVAVIMDDLKAERDGLKTKSADIAQAIIACHEMGKTCFDGFRGRYLTAKEAKNKAESTGIGKDWKRFQDAMYYHFGVAGYRATWPKLIDGSGEFTLVAIDEARKTEKAKRIAQEEKDRVDRAKFITDQETAMLEAWRALGPLDVAHELASRLETWSTDQAERVNVLRTMLGIIDPNLVITAKPKTKTTAKPKTTA